MSLRFVSKLLPSLAIVAAALFVTVPASAAGDAARGKTLGYTCLGCHGIETYKNVYPTYSVPKLRGQHAQYLVAALQGYARGERSHATMHAHASTLSDQDMQDVAAYLAGGEVVSTDAEPVGTAPASLSVCQSCHGRDGVGITSSDLAYPTLAGQHADYLEQALNEYRSGSRKNPLMSSYASQLKPEEIREIAEYFAKQKPSLKTVPRIEKLTTAAK